MATKRRTSGKSGKSTTAARYAEEGYLRHGLWVPPDLLPELERLADIHGDRTKAMLALLRESAERFAADSK
jgi:hypothetical protein